MTIVTSDEISGDRSIFEIPVHVVIAIEKGIQIKHIAGFFKSNEEAEKHIVQSKENYDDEDLEYRIKKVLVDVYFEGVN